MNRLLSLLVCVVLVSRTFADTTGGVVGTSAQIAGTTAAPAPAGTTAAPAPAGTTAAPAPAGTTAASPSPAGTTAAAPAPVGTTGIQYLAAGSTQVSAAVWTNATCIGVLTNTYRFVPTGVCQAFNAVSGLPFPIYQITRLSANTLWSTLYANDSTCAVGSTLVASVILQNNVCGSIVVPIGGGATYTVYINAAWTAGSLTTGAATTAAAPAPSGSGSGSTTGTSSAATTVVGLLPIVLALVAALFA